MKLVLSTFAALLLIIGAFVAFSAGYTCVALLVALGAVGFLVSALRAGEQRHTS
jgi:hypothetical protein